MSSADRQTEDNIELKFELHGAQKKIHNSPAIFKVIAAGRRFGKTYLAAITCILEALKETNDRGYQVREDAEVMYIAPTFDQAKGIFWPVLKMLAAPVTASIHENTGVLTLVNGCRIRLKGTDNPDRMRGFKLRAAILDEYADMPDFVWPEIVLPALTDVEGSALFIGTPKGKNHFFDLFNDAETDESGDWEAFNFSTKDNPFITAKAFSRLTRNMSTEIERQEVFATFTSGGGKIFKEEWFRNIPEEPDNGQWYVTVDLAGFERANSGKKKSELKRLDDTAISVVKVCREGWYVKEIISGKWDVRETAVRIMHAANRVPLTSLGIEVGALKNAVMPYLEDEMRRLNKWFNVVPLSHGGNKKEDRIQWALQGRLEKGRIFLAKGDWNKKLLEQALDFPSKLSHDDLLDSLAYVDQISVTSFNELGAVDDWQPIDLIAGY